MKHWLIACSRLALLLILLFPLAQAAATDELLDPEQAFSLTVTPRDTDTLVAEWTVAEGHYLYRQRLSFESTTPGIILGEPSWPPGKIKEDEFFGEMEIYRGKKSIEIPIRREADAPNQLELQAGYQGCADTGICYPPQTNTVVLELPPHTEAAAATSTPQKSASPGLLDLGQSQEQFPDAEDAFILSVAVPDPTTVTATWDIAEGTYLYKDKIEIDLEDAQGIRIAQVEIPSGKIKEDEFFGRQEVFYDQVKVIAHLQRDQPGSRQATLKTSYQGCAEVGVCYPPLTQTTPIILPAMAATAVSAPAAEPPAPSAAEPPSAPVAEQDIISRMLVEQRFWAMPAFFGFGLLLAFTPCIFPMIPILSSLIVGHGENITQRQGLMLSVIYVLAMAITYTVAGVLAAQLGQNIQALFQNPWVLVSFSAVFALLALSMFGFYDLQLPASWQSKLTELSNRQGGGSYTGVAVMGLLSALIVGPCVAPPLIGVLAVIAATGDVFLGGTALFIMSLGMGAPLLAIGASAGQILPRAGHWMDAVKSVFGVLLLGVAIWMLERVLPAAITMLLWAILIILTATYMGVFQPTKPEMPGWHRLVRGLGVVLLVYGILLLVGVAAGSKDPLQPLRGVGLAAGGGAAQEHVEFKPIKTVADLEREVRQAGNRPVMLDFYADWCVSCKELEKYTFTDPEVQALWAQTNTVLLKADVTANDAADQKLMRRFDIIGPPAILFFGPDGEERPAYRVVGFMPAEQFANHLQQVLTL